MDLLDQEDVDEFRAAMRDVTDTFHRSPITLRRANGAEVELLVGMKPDDAEENGESQGELSVRDDRSEQVERWVISVSRDYLQELGLIDPAAPEAQQLLITVEDWVLIKGKRFAIIALTDRAIFRGVPILVRLTVAR
uniref:Uncharacterized protein n=1 Tax=Geobacter sp. (strain M21) TaxID=443144 RepID=C6E6Q9_GEOSM